MKTKTIKVDAEQPEIQFFDVRVSGIIDKDGINIKDINVFPFNASASTSGKWYAEHVETVASRSAKKLGRYLLLLMNEEAQRAVDDFYHATQKGLLNVKVQSLKISTTIKITAVCEGNVCGFSACSPFDRFKKSYGLKRASRRLAVAKKILKDGIPGKSYTLWMAAQKGNPFTVISIE